MDTIVRKAADDGALGAATIKTIAKYLGVNASSVYLWMANHSSFSEAIAHARGLADEDVVSALHERSKGYTMTLNEQRVNKDGQVVELAKDVHVPADTAAATFWLKNRQRKDWTDTTKVEVTSDFAEQVEAILRAKREGK
jgi:hypothetical protein